MELYDIVTRLVGPVSASECCFENDARLRNLNNLIELHEKLTFLIYESAHGRKNEKASVKKIGELAHSYLKDLPESLVF